LTLLDMDSKMRVLDRDNLVMTLRKLIVSALDRPGGRSALANIASLHAKRLARSNSRSVRVFYDRLSRSWGREYGGEHVIDGARFEYFGGHLLARDGAAPWRELARKNWLQHCEVRSGDVVLDIGAEVGTDTVLFDAMVGPDGLVLAIEAHPVTFLRLKRTLQLSHCDRTVPILAAIAAVAGPVFIEDGPDSLSSTISTGLSGQERHSVPGVTLDALCDEYGITDVALLKMNIEGAEAPALEGMSKCLRNTRNVVIACHDFRADAGEGELYRTRDKVRAKLTSLGFELLPNTYNPAVDHVSARDHIFARRT
jgi:FkbM family methyltransferase